MIYESILLSVRHALTAAGAYFVTSGIATSDEITSGVGAIATLIGLGWSWYRKWSRVPA